MNNQGKLPLTAVFTPETMYENEGMIVTPCFVSGSKGPDTVPDESELVECLAAWDTGSNACGISRDFAERLGLISKGKVPYTTASGTAETNTYHINLMLPNGSRFKHIRASEGGFTRWDLLIGMDVIKELDVAITHKDGLTKFTFQFPPTHDIDFTKE